MNAKDKLIIKYFKLISAYREVCKMANVPEIIIDNPNFIDRSKYNKQDIRQARKILKRIAKTNKITYICITTNNLNKY